MSGIFSKSFTDDEVWEQEKMQNEERNAVHLPGIQFRGAHTALLALILWAYLMISSEEILPNEKRTQGKETRWNWFVNQLIVNNCIIFLML